ncbi:hypothetical protein B0H21DRAFT_31472 [Amylocystis lapponica]|nr:hypothetical protein B0H21DRAFT_31472 [Amylocystis lapponica]
MPPHTLTLPPEIWQIILDFLSVRARRTCLLTSKLLHDIAAKTLFSSIDIWFGLWNGDPDVKEDSKKRELSRAWDILQHIVRNPSFAVNIKKVDIFFLEESAIFEQRFLLMALRELSNLRSFTWYNTSQELSPDVVTALVEFCPRLEAIYIPIPHHVDSQLSRLRHLRSIRTQQCISKYRDYHTCGYDATFSAVVSLNTITLRELSVWGSIFWDTIWTKNSLTHLELLDTSGVQDIARLLQETVCLESLTLSPVSWDIRIQEALEQNATALPRLTSFKLLDVSIHEEDIDGDNPVEAIANFLRGRHNLRRLDLWIMCEFDILLPLIQGLQWRELESLDVLGLGLDCEITMENILMVEHCIPRGLTALSFFALLGSDVSARFLDAFSGFPNLTFLYFAGDAEGLNCDDVVHTFQHLELFGYNLNTVMEIERLGDGTILATSKWSTRKIEFRTVEDFGCGDWEWLIRHHTIIDNDLEY